MDFSGRAPIHHAVCYGNIEAVKLLLTRNVNINQETQLVNRSVDGYPNEYRTGFTALDLAIELSKPNNFQEQVLRGGKLHIKQWENIMKAIIRRLVAKGARPGSRSPESVGLEAMRYIEPATYGNVTLIDINHRVPFKDDDVFRGAWPWPLPTDESSPSEAEVEKQRAYMNVQLPDGRIVKTGRTVVRDLLGSLNPGRLSAPRPEGLKEWLVDTANERRRGRPPEGLPEGWEARLTLAGRTHYVDHNTRSTTWAHPCH